MLALLIGAVAVLPALVMGTLEVAGSNKISTRRKVIWILVFWAMLGIFGVALYYFFDRKNTI
jgi:NADH:ubiquinone oxidoreductase subunit 6 (subunit J)